jgi:predicted transcriptional regulator
MPYDERDEDSGRFTPTFSTEDFLDALRGLGGAGGTQEVADEVGCAYRTAHAKLSELEDEGVITSRKVGNANLWMLPDE